MLQSYEYVNLADIIASASRCACAAGTFNELRRRRGSCNSERSCDFTAEKTRASSPGAD